MNFKKEDIELAIKYIKALSIPENFGIEDDMCEESVNDTERLMLQLYDAGCKKFRVFHGVSKAVIIIEELPFVIKIPYNGMWYPDYDEGEGNYFVEFQYATNDRPDDYCWKELCLSEDMDAAGFGKLVPEIMYAGEYGGWRFYFQEKVIPFDDEVEPERYTSKASRDRAMEIDMTYRVGCPMWRAAIIEKYGEAFLEDFIDWAECECEEVLEDLHARNYGFRCDGRPVIFDIGGFND